MKLKYFILVSILFLFFSNQSLFSQKIIVVERPGTVKNVKYKKGSEIFLETINKKRLHGRISQISDSAFFLNNKFEVKLKDISIVLKPRGFLYRSYPKIRFAGYGFLFLNTFNRIIHNEKPVFDKTGLITGFSMIGLSYVMQAFIFKKQEIGEKWRIKVIDL